MTTRTQTNRTNDPTHDEPRGCPTIHTRFELTMKPHVLTSRHKETRNQRVYGCESSYGSQEYLRSQPANHSTSSSSGLTGNHHQRRTSNCNNNPTYRVPTGQRTPHHGWRTENALGSCFGCWIATQRSFPRAFARVTQIVSHLESPVQERPCPLWALV